MVDSNERLMNCIYPDGIPELQSNCSNCICCMNKELNPFCFELNQSVELDYNCKLHERN
jgi:hypothetical protein